MLGSETSFATRIDQLNIFPSEFGNPVLIDVSENGNHDTVFHLHRDSQIESTGMDHLVADQGDKIAPLLNRNFDLRRETCQLSPGNLAMVDSARATGASAKFTGSGGAIVGTYESEDMFQDIRTSLEALGCEVFKPQIVAD